MIISMIAAIGKNNVIGTKNSLPWKLPADMKHFVQITKGKPVIMGRKTFESIGKPLANRINVIITHDYDFEAEGCVIAHSVDEALKAAEGAEEALIIGGAQIYKEFLPLATKMYLTKIDAKFNGDAYFPEYNLEEWEETAYEEHESDKDNSYDYAFVVLERKIR
jgi:dihydrofolate reductase